MRVALVLSFLAACDSSPTPDPTGPREAPLPMPITPARDGPSSLAHDANRFGLDVWRGLDAGNVVFSPSGLAVALALVGSGAHGDTAAAFTRAFHGTSPRVMAELVYVLRGATSVESSTELVIDDDVALTDDYRRLVTGFGATVGVDADLGLALRLTHRATLSSRWQSPFEPVAGTRTFYAYGALPRDVPMMHKLFARSEVEYRGLEALELVMLPHATGDVQTILVVPRARTGLAAVEALLDETFLERLERPDWTQVDLTMPKVDLASTGLDLGAALARGPLAAAFEPGADFGSIDRRSYLGAVRQSTTLRLDEGGVHAHSRTEVEMFKAEGLAVVETPARVDLVVDRPFLVLVRARETGVILLVARVVDL